MNQPVAGTTARFVGAATVKRIAAPMPIKLAAPVNHGTVAQPAVPYHAVPIRPASLPLTNSRNGNLFVDRNDPKLHWYLPQFTVFADVDPDFAFVASQSGQDAKGNPFNKAQLTLRLQKSKPADVQKIAQSTAAVELREIPLSNLSASLVSVYTGDSGQQLQRMFPAAIQNIDANTIRLTFDGSILGPSVVGLYQDLTVFGKAVICLSASYQAWLLSSPASLPPNLRLIALSRFADTPVAATELPHAPGVFPRRPVQFRSFAPLPPQPHRPIALPAPALVDTTQPWSVQVPLGLKYKQDAYQLKYSVSTSTSANHVIRDAADLNAFSVSQTEFAELKALGDISQKYPTVSRLFVGVLSRTIVAIPKRYSIVRGRSGCAALCMALVDSSAADGSRCKFEFDFTIAPEVSRIDFLKLTQDILSQDELKGYTLKLPEFQRNTPPSTLATEFQSETSISAGTEPHTFSVNVGIRDGASESPAVANANLFIMRLCTTSGADLVGSLSLKLDDGYPDAIVSAIDLNFSHSAGTDEIVAEFEEGAGEMKLTNQSPLDLQISRYALIKGAVVTEVDTASTLPANGSLSIPLPADHADLMFAADAQIRLPGSMAKADVTRFLHFQTADVQATQYVVAVDGSGIDFKKVESVIIDITFANLANLTPRSLKLNKDLRADSTHIVVPLENAIFSLPGNVSVQVHFTALGSAPINFTMQNDFNATPVLLVLQSDIDQHVAKS